MTRRAFCFALAAASTACEPSPPDLVTPTRPVPVDVSATPAAIALSEHTQQALEALGYAPAVPTDNPETRGTATHVDGAWPGLNLYSSRHRASALLVDMGGRVVHRWEAKDPRSDPWMHIEPRPNGALLVIIKDRSIALLDRDSNPIWHASLRAHHDAHVRPDGTILVLTRKRAEVLDGGRTLPVLADFLTVLSPAGELRRTVPLLGFMRAHVSPGRLARLRHRLAQGESRARLLRGGGLADVLHANSVETLRRPIDGVAPAGAVLLSFRALSRIAILSPDLEEVLFVWGEGVLDGQHDAKQLDNGNLLLFDNGLRRRWSRVIELNPVTGDIVWTYRAPGFHSRIRGAAQALPNGNVLVTESEKGRAFEVKRSGELVWEYWNPDVRRPRGRPKRGVIYRLNRFEQDDFPF